MTQIEELKEALISQGYIVEVCNTKDEASRLIDNELDNKVIGIGGSQTVKEMGLFEMLSKHNEVYWHDQKPEDMTVMETRQAAFRSAVYISSVNGISKQGDIINIDATGNRVAAISFGPQDVYFVIGKNKIADSFDEAMYRARNVAAPLNARRLNRKTPCAVDANKCFDCSSPDRICNNFVVFSKKPFGARYHVFLINEDLGY